MKLTDISYVKRLMSSHGISPKKKFGQNFLLSDDVPRNAAEICAANGAENVIEIGPGIGTLTQYLCESFKSVAAVEIDGELLPVLKETLSDYDNVKIINGDILKTDLNALIDEAFGGGEVSVCANLPYYITSPVIMYLLESGARIKNITVMIQKEVADRFCALPGSPEYGAITAVINYYASAEKCFTVPPSCFIPAPSVTSEVINLNIYKKRPVEPSDERKMFKIISAAFSARRKTLVNALALSLPELTKEKTSNALASMGLNADIRGEKLSLAQFAELSDILYSQN